MVKVIVPDNMASGYRYRPLNHEKQGIRLLCFNISDHKHTKAGDLSCKIQHVSMQQDPLPEYYAISYTWADSTKRSDILVDGQTVSISQNAETALRYLHKQRSEQKAADPSAPWEVRVWLDALCINQSNLDEKAEQLLLMGEIYSRAKEVLVWLGEDEGSIASEAIRSIRGVVETCKKDTNNLSELFETVWQVSSSTLMSPKHSTIDPFKSSTNLFALRKFYAAPWFQRLWILQEVMLSKRAVCYRGAYSIPLYEVILAGRWMWYRVRGKILLNDTIYMNHTIGIQNASTMWDMMNTPDIIPRTPSNLLLLGMRFETTDPRDKVYSILGLLDPIYLRTAYSSLIPDYSVPIEGLYGRATRSIILDTKSLFILKLGSSLVPTEGPGIDVLDRPSWIARYDWVHDANRGSPSVIRAMYRPASKNSTLRLRQVEGLPSILTVQGVVVDEITHTSDLAWEDNIRNIDSIKPEIDSTWTAATKYGTSKYHGSLEAAYAVTICCNRDQYSRDINKDPHFYLNIASFFKKCGQSSFKALGEYLRGVRRDSGLPEGDAGEYLRAIAANSRHLRFFIDSSGRLGMGPKASRANDRICIIPGYDVPMILRQEGVFWRHIGPAFVYGIMDGEYFQMLEGSAQLEDEMKWLHIH